jgi:hypothetical protein
MRPQRTELDNQAVRLLGSLKYDPGHLLLIDILQARLDDITDELADAPGPEKLPYWRAFREIFTIVRDSPLKFAQAVGEFTEIEERENPAENPLIQDTTWQRMSRAAQRYADERTEDPIG